MTDTPAPATPTVKPTQADIDRAATTATDIYYANSHSFACEADVEEMEGMLVQAFAAHAAPLLARIEELEQALAPFADAFDAARDKYIRRYRSNPTIGATNFDAMPDEWKMDTVMFTMGDFRRARALLAKGAKP